ncbi:MAG: DUF6114 domain-containing protein [Candidatus Micrarchaeia archaeon]
MPKQSNAPFVLLVIGGLLIVLGGIFSTAVSVFGFMWMMGYRMAVFPSIMMTSAVAGIILGGIILYSAPKTLKKGKERHDYAVIALVASVLSLLNGGGFFVGFLLSLIGAILALS